MEILNCKDLSFTYNGSTEKVLKDINFSVQKGELILIQGGSGCGKTTLLKALKPELSPLGKYWGEIFLEGKRLDKSTKTPQTGFLMQNTDSQTVCSSVYEELCFGGENLGFDSAKINRRIGETVSYFGIGHLLHREISTLSGGEKQLVALCSVMVTDPGILILDEPVSRLDPVAAEELAAVILRINRELGTTVIVAEHFAEGFFYGCDKVMLMDNGSIADFAPPKKCAAENPGFRYLFPCSVRILPENAQVRDIPLTVREGRKFLSENYSPAEIPQAAEKLSDESVLECRDLWFRYSRSSPDILAGTDLTLHRGEIFTAVGANGAGKSTLLKCLGGLLSPYSGKIKVMGKPLKGYKSGALYHECISVLPQDPYDMFIRQTVRDDYRYALSAMGRDLSYADEMGERLGISRLMERHPYDLSGGEAQLCAIGKALLSQPKILLLDEPVKGLDLRWISAVGKLLLELKAAGISVLCVSHDLEFAAEYSDRCGLFFDGRIISAASPREFFSDSSIYTTSASRIARRFFRGAVTAGQISAEIARQEAGR